MITTARSIAALILIAVAAAPAWAQSHSLITLTPDRLARWDVSVHYGRQGVNRSDVGVDWDSWYEAPHVTGSAGFYWTPNLKLELDVARAAETAFYVPQTYEVPGQFWPYTRSREHRLSTLSSAASVQYQFFENRWFHPFVGAGVELLRERERADAQPAAAEVRSPSGQLVFPATPTLPELAVTTVSARPLVSAGFKVYLSQSAFVRSDLRVAVSGRGAETMTWRAGVGVDF